MTVSDLRPKPRAQKVNSEKKLGVLPHQLSLSILSIFARGKKNIANGMPRGDYHPLLRGCLQQAGRSCPLCLSEFSLNIPFSAPLCVALQFGCLSPVAPPNTLRCFPTERVSRPLGPQLFWKDLCVSLMTAYQKDKLGTTAHFQIRLSPLNWIWNSWVKKAAAIVATDFFSFWKSASFIPCVLFLFIFALT